MQHTQRYKKKGKKKRNERKNGSIYYFVHRAIVQLYFRIHKYSMNDTQIRFQ
jgi:hypothetical protein